MKILKFRSVSRVSGVNPARVFCLLTTFLVFSFLLSSCEVDEDQQVVEKLGGEWLITDIEMLTANVGNITYPNRGNISFEVCEASRCDGSLQLAGLGLLNFRYLAISSPLELNLLTGKDYAWFFAGQYKIDELSDSRLVFRGTMIPTDNPDNLNANQLQFRFVCIR